MVPGPVEVIAEPDNHRSLANEVNRQTGRAIAEKAGYGVQLSSSGAEVCPSNRKVSRTKPAYCDKQQTVLRVPKPVLPRRLWLGIRLGG